MDQGMDGEADMTPEDVADALLKGPFQLACEALDSHIAGCSSCSQGPNSYCTAGRRLWARRHDALGGSVPWYIDWGPR